MGEYQADSLLFHTPSDPTLASLAPLPLTPRKSMWTEGGLENRRGPGGQRGIKRIEDLDQSLRSLPGAVWAEEHWVSSLVLEL